MAKFVVKFYALFIFTALQLSFCTPGPVTQLEASTPVDPGVASSIPAGSHISV